MNEKKIASPSGPTIAVSQININLVAGTSGQQPPVESVNTPPKGIKSDKKAETCWICKSSIFTRDGINYQSPWLVCSGDGTTKVCPKKVHTFCLGFPALSTKDDIYCKKHLGYGIGKLLAPETTKPVGARKIGRPKKQ